MQLLLLYEIADRARQVTSKKKLHEFEQWVRDILNSYKDPAVEQVANKYLFTLKETYAA